MQGKNQGKTRLYGDDIIMMFGVMRKRQIGEHHKEAISHILLMKGLSSFHTARPGDE